MNSRLQKYARMQIIEGLAKCTEAQVLLFKRMYSHEDLTLAIEKVVEQMSEEKLDWAMEQVEGTVSRLKTKPRDLEEAMIALGCILIKDYFGVQELTEKEFGAALHDNLGRWIRNNWGLWSEEGELHAWFKSLGIWHPDDMSGIILTSYLRKVHNLPINLEEQVKHYVEYWEAEQKKKEQKKEQV